MNPTALKNISKSTEAEDLCRIIADLDLRSVASKASRK